MFGLVHGAGFANYLHSLFITDVALPLFGFNVGIELGQLTVLLLAGSALVTFDRVLAALSLPAAAPTPLRLRVITVSTIVTLIAAHWAIQRAPW